MAKKKRSSKAKAVPAAKRRSAKSASKANSTPKKKVTRKKKASKNNLSRVDQRLMNMAADRYERLFKKISQQSSRLNEERKMALEVGQRVLKKVKYVQDSITDAAIQHSPLDLSLIGLTVKKRKAKKPSAKNL